MKKTSFILFLILAVTSCSKNADTDWPEITAETKPWTRWWWMGNDVDPANLTYNLEELSRAGIGGVEITPIYGVKDREDHYIDFLSPKWMEMLSFTELESERLGLGVSMNTGTGWPFGGPDISIEDAAEKAIFQEYEFKSGEKFSDSIVVNDPKQKEVAYLSKLMAYNEDGISVDITDKVSADGILTWEAPSPHTNYKLIALFVGKTLQKVKRAAPGGEGYVLNHFDKEAVMRYFGKFDKAFDENKVSYPKGFFNDSYEVYGADWTGDLLAQFETRRGYRLQDYFPELLADGNNDTSARVISDYRETISEILKDNFTEPWTQWAHSHNSTTRNQAHGCPANLLDLYAAVDIPECESFGITDFDIPGLRKDSLRKINDSDPTVYKYASSAAHIAGKKYTSSETFTWLSEHFRTSLSQCKPEIDQLFTSGVNRVFFHGTTYSPKDAPWPGWKFYASIDMSPTNSIWKDAPSFFQYVTRSQSFLQAGKPDNDFLLYFPMYDVWEEQRGKFFTMFAIHGMKERLPKFCDAVNTILQCGYDLDYISDYYIQSTTVENGLLKTEGGTLYKAIILPSVKYLPLNTLERLNRLVEQGATIIFSEQYPSEVPGLYDLKTRQESFNVQLSKLPQIKDFKEVSVNTLGKGRVLTGTDYKKLLAQSGVKEEIFVSEMGGQLVRRVNEDGHHYFFAMLQNNTIDGWLKLAVDAKSAMFFDPMTGEKGKAKIRINDGATEVYMQLKSGGSIILKTFTDEDVNVPIWNYYQNTDNKIPLARGWNLSFTDSEPAITDSFQLASLVSWTDLDNDLLTKNMGTGKYSITFDLKKNQNSEYRLVLGDVRESARINVNGKDAGTLFAVPFEMNIGSLLRDGKNTLEVYVTNLPANRIADYDRNGIEWRKFKEINFVDINYKPTFYDMWSIVPSGLLGPVYLEEIKRLEL